LTADPARTQTWRNRLDPAPLRVGLCWAGSTHGWETRSRTLATFAPLGGIDGVQFVSLQVGPEASQAQTPPFDMRLSDYSSRLNDFSDLAALIANLDLVITVDTAVAHVAGALAKPVWVLIPQAPDFRWMLDRADSPWYPTMRLFRQIKRGDWDTPVRAMAAALASFRGR
jgi:hypothetical protein